MKKQQIKEFQMFVDTFLPKFLINSTETHLLTGAELIQWGFTHEPDNPEVRIDPVKMYTYKQPVQTEVDHVRRIRKAFQNNGKDGINHYLSILAKKLRENIKQNP